MRFSARPDRPWGPLSLLYKRYRVFPGVKYGRGVLLTTHPLLVPRSWKSRAIPLPTIWATTGPVTGSLYLCRDKGVGCSEHGSGSSGSHKIPRIWAITQQVVAIPYRRFGTSYRSHLEGSRMQEFLCNLSDCWRLRKGSVAWSRWNLLIRTLLVAG